MKKMLISFIMLFTVFVVNMFSISKEPINIGFDNSTISKEITRDILINVSINGGSGEEWDVWLDVTIYCNNTIQVWSINPVFFPCNIYWVGAPSPDSVIVTACLTNYYTDTITFYPPFTTPGYFVLNPMPATISGTVILNGGCGEITEATIEVDGNTTHPDSAGNYSIDVDLTGVWTPAYYDVTASLENYQDSTITNVQVMENQTTPDIDFALNPLTETIQGYVSFVNFENPGNTGPEPEYSGYDSVLVTIEGYTYCTIPDSTGYYIFENLFPGVYNITVNYFGNTYEGLYDDGVPISSPPGFNNFGLDYNGPVVIQGMIYLIGGDGDTWLDTLHITNYSSPYSIEFFNLMAFIYEIVFQVDEYLPFITEIIIFDPPEDQIIEIDLTFISVKIEGTVTIASGNGNILDVNFEIIQNDTLVTPFSINWENVTQYSGDYQIDVNPGVFEVTALLENYSDSTRIIELGNTSNTTGEDFILYPCVAVNDNNAGSIFYLSQNYPNPFSAIAGNPATTISFSIPNLADVEISIFNIKGQKIKTIVNEKINKGKHTVFWNGKDSNNENVASGLYFFKLKAGKDIVIKKMILLE